MTNLVKKLFGDPGNDEGIERQEKSNELLREFIQRQTDMARADIRKAMPSQQAAMTAGTQAGLDIYGQAMPQQMEAMTGGNVAAQQAILAGMPMYEAAMRGGSIDYSAMQPYQGSYDMSFAQQTLPEAVANPAYMAEAQTIDPRNPYVSPNYQNQQAQMMQMGGNPAVMGGGSVAGLGGTPYDDFDFAGYAEYEQRMGYDR